MGFKKHIETLDPAYYILVPVCCAIVIHLFVNLGIAVIGASVFTKIVSIGIRGMSLSAYRDAVGIEAGGLSTRELRIKAQADDQNPKAKAAIHAAKADDYAAVLIVLSLVVTLGVHHG